jgi:two-component sensor histidine kinase
VNLEDLYRLLRGEHVQAQRIVDTVDRPLLVLDRDLRVVAASRAFFQTFQVGRDETCGRRLLELGDGQWAIPDLQRLLEEVVPRSAAVVDYAVTHDFPRLGRRTMLLTARKLFHPDGTGTTLLLSIEDATARRRKEEEQDLLLDELRHRGRNLFALVHALARQTEAAGRSGEEYRDDFLGRFQALERAHELTAHELTAHELTAPGRDGADLGELVAGTLAPYAADPAAAAVEPGPAVALAAARVLPLGLVLHELATNAVKHGALSAPGGQVRVGWTVEPDGAGGGPCLRLRWAERGGPAVAPPTHRGFGTRLIAFTATHQLRGRAELSFAPEGFEAEIVVRLG